MHPKNTHVMRKDRVKMMQLYRHLASISVWKRSRRNRVLSPGELMYLMSTMPSLVTRRLAFMEVEPVTVPCIRSIDARSLSWYERDAEEVEDESSSFPEPPASSFLSDSLPASPASVDFSAHLSILVSSSSSSSSSASMATSPFCFCTTLSYEGGASGELLRVSS